MQISGEPRRQRSAGSAEHTLLAVALSSSDGRAGFTRVALDRVHAISPSPTSPEERQQPSESCQDAGSVGSGCPPGGVPGAAQPSAVLPPQIIDLTMELSDERHKGDVACQVLDGERAERLRGARELQELQVGDPSTTIPAQPCSARVPPEQVELLPPSPGFPRANTTKCRRNWNQCRSSWRRPSSWCSCVR